MLTIKSTARITGHSILMILIAGILGACNTLSSANQPQNIAIENAQDPASIADYGSRIGFKGGKSFGGLMTMKKYRAADYIYNSSMQLDSA
ncbi:hypothetical protein [Snodgrassella communis]|uniref:hypothetical protein n=1 Tax=Snodgrassella communis TaxID=2946699 RepID=UPI00286AD6B3|nr:hypothetical protein [Snodgrassella communis]WMY92124.1 hypothetical protein PYG29_01755 [Snodgrassella communis]